MTNFEKIISAELNISEKSVAATIKLLNDGATIPFISRYRKEVTGSLDEVAIRDIQLRYADLQELAKRKEYLLERMEAAGALTVELRQKIEQTFDATTLEDLFLPYKPKRRTKAAIARERGLEPLAKIIMSQNEQNIESRANRFVNGEVASIDKAINGALDIMSEWVS